MATPTLVQLAADRLGNGLRLYSEACHRFSGLVEVDAEEAVGNHDRAFDGILSAMHSLYDAMKTAGVPLNFYAHGDTEACLLVRNARHHNTAGLFQSWNSLMMMRGGLRRMAGAQFLMVGFTLVAGEGVVSRYYVPWDDFRILLADPKAQVARAPYADVGEHPNVFWARHSRVLEWLVHFADPAMTGAGPDEMIAIYTADRDSTVASEVVDAYRGSLPGSLATMPSDRIGYVEADILHWLFSEPSRPLLHLVGARGSGKSTVIRYLFKHLPHHHAELSHLLTVIVDLRYGKPLFAVTDSPQEAEIAVAVATELMVQLRHLGIPEVHAAFDRLQLLDNDLVSSTMFFRDVKEGRPPFDRLVRLVGMVNELLGERRRVLLLAFDNLDQLTPFSIARIMQMATAISTLEAIRIILPQRNWNNYVNASQVALRR